MDAAQFVRPWQTPTAPPPGGWPGGRQPAGPPSPGQPAWGAPPPGASGYPPFQPSQRRASKLTGLLADRRRLWIVGATAAAVIVVIVALVVATSGDDGASTYATATSPAQVPAGPTTTPRGATTAAPAPPPAPPTAAPPPPPVVDAAALPGLLLPAGQINQRMNTTGLTPITEDAPLEGSITPPQCAGAWGPIYTATYNGSGYTALAAQGYLNSPTHKLVQAVVAFPDAGAAKAFYDRQVADWDACKSTHIRFEYNGVTEADLGVPAVTGDVMSLMLVPTTSSVAGQQCERDMAVRSNVIVDVRACSPTVGSAGLSIASEIADKVGRTP